MKCPKCGYISFDYNQVCPKCSKDISSEQEKLHIAAFRPDPPSLLGALIGEANESHMGIRMPEASETGYEKEADIEFGDSSAFESGEVSFDSRELVRNMESQEAGFGGETGDLVSEPAADTSDFEFESPVEEETPPEAAEFGDITPEGPAAAGGGVAQEIPPEEADSPIDSSELNLDDLSLDESGSTSEAAEESIQKAGIDFEGPDSGAKKADEREEKDEIELNLDDLKVNNDTGELEVNTEGDIFEDVENPLQMDEISLEETPVETEKAGEEKARDASSGLKEESGGSGAGPEEDDLSIDLEDLDLDLDLDNDKPKSTA